MAIGVLIKRETKDGTEAKALMPHIIEIRSLAVRQAGYISGETLFNLEYPQECVVISRWTTLEHWQAWLKNDRRIELNEKIETLTGAKTQYSVYNIGLW